MFRFSPRGQHVGGPKCYKSTTQAVGPFVGKKSSRVGGEFVVVDAVGVMEIVGKLQGRYGPG